MRGSFSESNLNDFLSDLLIGRGGLVKLPGQVKWKKADKWDGKDAPVIEETLYEDL
jgi:hypothetical protein